MIDRAIPLLILASIATLMYTALVRTDGSPWAIVRDYLARQRAWRNGDELDLAVHALADPNAGSPEPGSQPRCPRCGGRRCRPFRDGLDCGPAAAPPLRATLLGTGRHEAWYREPVPQSWLPPRVTWRSMRERVGALPRIGVLP